MTLAAVEGLADPPERAVEDILLDELEVRGLMEQFLLALQSVEIAMTPMKVSLQDGNWPIAPLSRFLSTAGIYRVRIHVDGGFSGSGCLIGPSLVLTAWHVIANWPSKARPPVYPSITVEFADGSRRPTLGKPVYERRHTDAERSGRLPSKETLFRNRDDVVLLKLERPYGKLFGFAKLPDPAPDLKLQSAIAVLHYPNGVDTGIGTGFVVPPSSNWRWSHSVTTAPGSSGGPCFTTDFHLSGIHQGRWAPNKRLIPTSVFATQELRKIVRDDVAPPALWSLDGTSRGTLVIGRDLFFEAVAAATIPESRVHGVRVKRRDPTQGSTGLSFSFEMLTLTLERNRKAHRTIRVGFDGFVADLIDDVRRRARAAGLELSTAGAASGSGIADTTLEAAINERARIFAGELNAEAYRHGQLIWLLFENPGAGLSEAERIPFEALVGAILRQSHLRLLITGFETITTPGEEFANAGSAGGDGAPGLVVEYFGGFTQGDVETMFHLACEDFGVDVDRLIIADRARQCLQGLPLTNGVFAASDLKTVSERAVFHLDDFASRRGGRT